MLKKRTLITFYSDVRWPFLFGVGCVTALDGCASRLALRIFRQASWENQEPKIIVLIFSVLLEFVGRFWRTRNDWVFSDILVRHPKHIAHRTFGFLQQWRALSTKEAKRKVEDLLTKLHVKLQAL